jgi:hypothetical protein
MSTETQVEAAEESTESETTEAESPTKFIVESNWWLYVERSSLSV